MRPWLIPPVFLIPVLIQGCGTLEDGRRWGEDATLLPGLDRLGWAARRAAFEPMTWAPAAGALVFTIDHFDRRVSNWASGHTPVFGSQTSADDASDLLNVVQAGGTAATFMATPSGDEAGEWLLNKAKGGAVEGAGLLAVAGVTEGLKDGVGRTRPNGAGTKSFPSGHASFAFSLATESSRNVESLSLPPAAEMTLQASFYTLAGADAWARVEARKHFPSDVLAGAAIGHFLSAFIHDAFLGLPEKSGPAVAVTPLLDGGILEVSWSF